VDDFFGVGVCLVLGLERSDGFGGRLAIRPDFSWVWVGGTDPVISSSSSTSGSMAGLELTGFGRSKMGLMDDGEFSVVGRVEELELDSFWSWVGVGSRGFLRATFLTRGMEKGGGKKMEFWRGKGILRV